MTLLRLHDVSASLDGKPVLNRISLDIRAGEFVGLLGPNGAGKSSLMRAAIGLLKSKGDIELGGQPPSALTPAERARRAAYMPQDRTIAWPVTVETLVGLGRFPHRTSRAEDQAAIGAALRRMELEGFRTRPATHLSGGEAARVLIARALAQQAPLLIADEPLAGLDPAHAIALLDVFRSLAHDGNAVLVSLHDLGAAIRWCDRVILLNRGSIAADGPPAQVLDAKRLASVFGITAHQTHDATGAILAPTGLSSA